MTDSPGLLTLRPLVVLDAEVIAGWAADLEFRREAGWNVNRSFGETLRLHRKLIQHPPPSLIRLGAIHAGTLVGYVDLHGEEPDRRELGFVIGERRRWGAGLGRLAAAAGIDHAFLRLGLQEVWAEAVSTNQRSIRILQRLGMVETTGTEGAMLYQSPIYRQFAITTHDWKPTLVGESNS